MPLAAFQKSEQHDELTRLANQHIQSDLEPSDRDALRKATKRVATSTVVGSLVGLGLGLYASIRLRRVRTEMFAAFRASEKPSSVLFANGREGKQYTMDMARLEEKRKRARSVRKETKSKADTRTSTTEAVPDITHLMRPTTLGDFATYFFFGLGGTVLGGELGLATGTWSAGRGINQDPARRERIENAYRLLRIDFLRKEAARLESGGSALNI